MGQLKAKGAWLAGSALLALAACGEDSSSAGGGGSNGGGGSGEAGSNGTAGSGNSSNSAGGGEGGGIIIPEGGGGSGGGVNLTCTTPGEPGTIYELEAESQSIDIFEPVPMCIYRDDVLLVVNVAAL